ncbi:ABC-2 family transporter protein [Bifidobacterium lemurum]|uniref:ABC-2 family transporter protein n=1 Tax=Bifidobacterium lemurum TaxID=1603886 RepID=A0A261FUL2_9BIFI|nr:YhgE/Pip domain-containing protein [Bifidobacterium lemurum]OZG62870.1 ABC-2 family transporter protein [Bifidobacterium lemurum]QOL35195.1 YhgE/Pip domain-containing protein [Bifidobacterium lemurum]
MGNILAILKRDILRLLKVPTAWVIILGLSVLPSFYAWVNIIGFWDPYGNTASLQISVANNDRGSDGDLLGDINLGDQIVDQLKENHDIGWRFTDAEQAMDDVRSGDSYAAIIIPKDFSERLASLFSGDGERPELEYYVNEKTSPIAPKVTDSAANTVDQQVNSAFVSTVSEVVTQALNDADDQVSASTSEASSNTVSALRTVVDNLSKARESIAAFNEQTNTTPDDIQSAKQALQSARQLGSDASQSLTTVSGLIASTQTSLNGFVSTSSSALDQSNSLLSQATTQATGTVSTLAGNITTANGHVGGALATLQDVNDRLEQTIDDLETTFPEYSDIADQLREANARTSEAIDSLSALNTSLGTTASDTGKLADNLNSSAQSTLSNAQTARRNLMDGALPQLTTGLTTLGGAAGTLGGQIASQSTLLDQADLILDQVNQAVTNARTALDRTDTSLAGLETRLNTTITDISALTTTSLLSELFGGDGDLDVNAVADFMLSPTVLDTQTVYPVNSYGSGMAPLFTNLALWAGAFMLVALIRLESDDEGIEGLTVTQAYMGRWALLAIVAAAQGVIATVGDLIIGVQTVNAAAFVLTGVIASLVYISVAYMLAATFQHVGKALIMVMIIVQIPGAGGMYPIEMMPDFFRNLHPFFPFTYAIDAFRETIAGFYGTTWAVSMAKLLLFAALSFAVGLYVRPMLANLNRLFAREIAESDILNGEPTLLKGHEYRISQIVQALADHDEYRAAIEARAARFTTLYPRLKHGALIVGFVVPGILAITFSLTTGAKLVVLGTWAIWVLIVILFLMIVEFMHDSLRRQMALGNLSDDEIRATLAQRRRNTRTSRRAAAARSMRGAQHDPTTRHSERSPEGGVEESPQEGSFDSGSASAQDDEDRQTRTNEGTERSDA